MNILYSFRRCPFAIRARLALVLANINVEIREVRLREKPESLIQFSPKGTVPVLIDGQSVIEESLEIIKWTLDENQWLKNMDIDYGLVNENDTSFKKSLDVYKYWDRFPEKSKTEHRSKGTVFLDKLNNRLSNSSFLAGDVIGFEDISILPFVRQFANVDRSWFDVIPQKNAVRWLSSWENSELFLTAMSKYPVWRPGEVSVGFPMNEDIVDSEKKMKIFLKSLCGSDFEISASLTHSFENAPPKNLRIMLIRILRDLELSASPKSRAYLELSSRATKFFV